MKKLILVLALLFISHFAFAATWFFTGQCKMVQNTSFQMVWKCEYALFGKKHWVLMPEGELCPLTVELEEEEL